MATTFPTTVDSFPLNTDGVDLVTAADINNLQDAVVAIETAVITLSWTVATLGSSWVAFGAPYAAPAYAIDLLGVVHLKGVAKSGVVGNTIFTLPVGYRPLAQSLHAVLSNSTIGLVQVFTNGAVQLNVGSNVNVSFDGLTFPTN